MKGILSHIMLITLVVLTGTCEAGAQVEEDSRVFDTSLYREKLCVFTDRNLYASGEKVRFRLYNLSHPLLKENIWSRAFYLELVNSRNAVVARGKYGAYAWGGEGQLIIPDTVRTGAYYLRAYTRWMRNYPPSDYFHLPLAIVNPSRISSADLSAGTGQPGSGADVPVRVHKITCTPDKPSYGKREMVSIRINPENSASSPDAYCISVIKKGYLDEAFCYNSAPAQEDSFRLKELIFFPETRGATVSGTILLGEEQKPAERALLGMTMLGSDPDYFEFMTDENGIFRIPVQQLTGNRDALLTVRSNPDEPVRILTDDAFSPDFSGPSIPATCFFAEGRARVEDILVNSQLRKAFEQPESDRADSSAPVPEYLFYGSPEFRYRTEDYVALPDLEEFLFEIIHQVRIENNRDTKQLFVLDDRDEILDPPPLILLDYVPVQEIGDLLAVSPQWIDHVDVVNRRYFRGEQSYGGIVSVISRRGDRAGIALPGGSDFIRFTGLNDRQETVSPDYEGAIQRERVPDLRNTLYWEALYEITPENGGSIAFYTSDQTGEFTLVIRGMTSDGNVLSGTCEFTVK